MKKTICLPQNHYQPEKTVNFDDVDVVYFEPSKQTAYVYYFSGDYDTFFGEASTNLASEFVRTYANND